MLRVRVRWWLAASAILLPLVVTFSWIRHRALQAHDQAATEIAETKRVAARFGTLDLHSVHPAEAIAAAADFRDAAVLHGRVYLCSPDAMYGYDVAGSLIETYRVGRELPPGELTALGKSGTDLFITTRGAGVLTFDGTRFHQILPTNPHLRNFTSVLGLNAGRTLLGTPDRGVLIWDGKTLTDFVPTLKNAHVTVLAGSDADLWIGTLADGAWRLHAGQLDHTLTDLPDPHVLSIATTLGADSYIGTPVGVVGFRDGKKTRTLAEGYFAQSLEADNETLAVGTEDEGIVTIPLHSDLRPVSNTASTFTVQGSKAPVARIIRLDGIRYALAGGLYKSEASRSKWTPVLEPVKATLADRNIAALSLARDGRLWVGYFDRGLDVVDGSLENVRHFEDQNLFCVNRIVEEPGGARTAVATANGLVMFDASATVRQVMGRKDGLLADHVTDVLFGSGGMVMATPAGLSVAGRGGVRSIYVLQGLINNHVYSLASAGDRIAAGTLGGLSVLDKGVVEVNYTTANSGLRHNWISAVARVGSSWFAGTYGAGVMQLDASGHWTGFSDLKRGFEVNPNAMTQTGDSLYVGSLADGLWIYSKTTQRWRNMVTGLPSLNVTAVAAGNGYVYVGTDNGLVRFHEGELQ